MPIQYLKFIVFLFFLNIQLGTYACDTTQTVKCKSYFEDGSLKTIQRYKNGVRHGTWIVKNKEGRIVLKTRYKKGRRLWQFTYVNNKVVESIDRKGRVKKVKDCGC